MHAHDPACTPRTHGFRRGGGSSTPAHSGRTSSLPAHASIHNSALGVVVASKNEIRSRLHVDLCTTMERKVRPIYDALDARNPKQALKLCDGVLKKGAVPLVSALKAVALSRMARMDEAVSLARDVGGSLAPPVNEHVLSTLNMVFKAAGMPQEMTAAYEAAFKAEPDNMELASGLFGAYMRGSDFAKAQQLSMKMHKLATARAAASGSDGGGEHVYWAACCLLVQVDLQCAPAPLTRHFADDAEVPAGAQRLLDLASAMLSKCATQGKLREPAHVRLYLAALRRQRAYTQMAEVAAAYASALGAAEEALRLQAECLERCGKHAEARGLHARILLEVSPDDWDAHRGNLRCAFAASTDGGASGGAGGCVAEAEELLSTLRASHPAKRGPLLASALLALARARPSDAAAIFQMSSHTAIAGASHAAPVGSGGDAMVGGLSAGMAAVDLSAADGTPSAELSHVTEHLATLFRQFRTKPVCTLDSLPLLAALRHDHAVMDAALLRPLEAEFALATADDAQPAPPLELPWLRTFISHAEWSVGCGRTLALAPDAREALARRWVALFFSARPLSAGLDVRERGHADGLPLLAAQVRHHPGAIDRATLLLASFLPPLPPSPICPHLPPRPSFAPAAQGGPPPPRLGQPGPAELGWARLGLRHS